MPGRRTPLLFLLTASTISQLGSAMTLVAVPWYVLTTTGSAAAIGLVGAVTVLCEVVSGFFGGALVDRLGHRRASIGADLLSGAAVAAVPALHAIAGLAYWQLLLLIGLRALTDAPGGTGRQSMVPDLAREAGMSLDRINGAINAIFRGSTLAGAPTAGLLIVLVGPPNLLWLDAASFGCSALLVAGGVPGALIHRSRPHAASYRHDLLDGLRYVLGDPLIRSIAVTVAVANFLDSPVAAVALPLYARHVFGTPLALGVLVGANAAGHLSGSLLYTAAGWRLPRRPTYLLAWLGAAAGFLALALAPNLAAAAAAEGSIGLLAAPINPIIVTALQERVPPELRARVFGPTRALAWVAMPLGLLVGGVVFQVAPLRQVLMALASTYVLVVIAMWANPSFRGLERPAPANVP